VQGARAKRKFRDVPGVGNAQALRPYVLDVLRPWIDERHVLARLHHMGADIPADGARSNNSYLRTHAFIPRSCWQPRLARRLGSSQKGEPEAN
jgi:hypothetical protein